MVSWIAQVRALPLKSWLQNRTYPVYRILRFRHQWTFPRTLTWSIYGQWIGLIWIYFQHRKRKSGDGGSLVLRERRHRIRSTMELVLFYFYRLMLGLVRDARNIGRIHPKLDYMAKYRVSTRSKKNFQNFLCLGYSRSPRKFANFLLWLGYSRSRMKFSKIFYGWGTHGAQEKFSKFLWLGCSTGPKKFSNSFLSINNLKIFLRSCEYPKV